MALGVQHFIIIRQIVENTVTVELPHRFIAGEMLAVFVLLYTKRHEIRYVLLFVHNYQLQRYKSFLKNKKNNFELIGGQKFSFLSPKMSIID